MGSLHPEKMLFRRDSSYMVREKTNLGEQLNLQLDHQVILQCYGRYKNANLDDEVKYPKLLPKKEHYTRLVIKDLHSKLFHAGVTQQTLAHIRKDYWITHGQSQVKKVLNQCRICRRTEGNPFKMLRIPPWPK